MNYKLLFGAAALLALFACKPDAVPENKDKNGGDEGQQTTVTLTEPVLTVSPASVELVATSEEVAATLTWTSAGENATYTVERTIGGVASSVAVEGLTYSFTHKQLAELGEAPYEMSLKIKASASGMSDVWSNSATLTVTGSSVVLPEHLYIYFWAWDNATNAQEMTKVSDGVFSWTGDCNQWEFKFLTAKADPDDYWTGYFRDPNAADYWTMIESTRDNQCMFKLDDVGLPGGNYTITANLNTLKVTVEKNEVLPEHLYLYFWEWKDVVAGSQEMTNLGDGKFTWTGLAPRWEFKFLTAKEKGDDYWTGYFRDPDAEDYWTIRESSAEVMFKLGDKGIRDGVVTISVDLKTKKVSVIPHIWLIGSAFSWGWTRNDAEEMTYTGDASFTWTGNLFAGIFKFLVLVPKALGLDDCNWYGYWRDASAAEYWTATENGEGDVQFEVSEAGKYTITISEATHVVTLTPVTE